MKSTEDLKIITKQVCKLAQSVGEFLKNEIYKLKSEDIEEKGVHNFVTYVDKSSEIKLMEELSKILPEAGFIAEESPNIKKGERFNWIIDPLDGTTNYIHSLPIYSISIALMEKNEIVLGVVYEVNMQECFYAWKGSKAYLNNRPIQVNTAEELKDTLFATGFPYFDYSKLEQYFGVLKYLIKNSHGIRRIGSAAVDLAYVACGRFDGFYEYSLSPWDVAAGALIVKQAGGIVSDFSEKDNYLFGKEIVATSKNVYPNFMKVLKKYFT